jgi:hypothetical protein
LRVSWPDGPFRFTSLGALDAEIKQPGKDLLYDRFARFLPYETDAGSSISIENKDQ